MSPLYPDSSEGKAREPWKRWISRREGEGKASTDSKCKQSQFPLLGIANVIKVELDTIVHICIISEVRSMDG